MTDLQIAGLYLFGCLQGLIVGYVLWAPETPFKQGLLRGLTFRFWRRP